MKRKEAPCPTCGAPVVFRTGAALVSVCEACGSVVARGDRRLEDHGKVAALVDLHSPLHIGQTGRFREHPFEIVGRIQYQHPAGGFWEEWHAVFPSGKWCWIAEAQGKRYLTYRRRITHHAQIPPWDDLAVGARVPLGENEIFSVAEFATATVVSAAGELPVDAIPGSRHRFADLTGKEGQFASLVYGPRETYLYRGGEVTLADLGISPTSAADEDAVIVPGTVLNCPQCGGSLELRAPDRSQRVTCPYCSSLLDVEHGSLRYLTTLELKIQPRIPLGSQGTLRGTTYLVIGFLRRAVVFDHEYTWDEYLLYHPEQGFRWLVESDRHWSFVEPVSNPPAIAGNVLQLEGEKFMLFQRAWASVVHVLGELYWKVAVGETVLTEDYIRPPAMISVEMTPERPVVSGRVGSEGWESERFVERVVSRGTYVTHEEVEQGFGLRPLPRGAAVAPNQPGPDYRSTYWTWPLLAAGLIGLDFVISLLVNHSVSHTWTPIAILVLSFFPFGLLLHQAAFETSRWADSEFTPAGTRRDFGDDE